MSHAGDVALELGAEPGILQIPGGPHVDPSVRQEHQFLAIKAGGSQPDLDGAVGINQAFFERGANPGPVVPFGSPQIALGGVRVGVQMQKPQWAVLAGVGAQGSQGHQVVAAQHQGARPLRDPRGMGLVHGFQGFGLIEGPGVDVSAIHPVHRRQASPAFIHTLKAQGHGRAAQAHGGIAQGPWAQAGAGSVQDTAVVRRAQDNARRGDG